MIGLLVALPVTLQPRLPAVAAAQATGLSYTGTAYRWTHVNQMAPNQSYWNYDRAEGAKVGFSWDREVRYRSFFQLPTGPIGGARIISATFSIILDHSPTSTSTPVNLYETGPIDPAVPLTWNNQGALPWKGFLDSASGHAWTAGGEPNMGMEFASSNLTAMVQRAANNKTGFVTVGLQAPDEGNVNQWKKFVPGSAKITIVYNHAPVMPTQLKFTRPLPCGSAADPTPIGTTQPQFSAVATDPNGQNLTSQLQLHKADGTLVHAVTSSTTTSGAAFAWPVIPDGKLIDGQVYSYSANSSDGLDNGPWTGRCSFRIDTSRPQTPSIESADFPDGEPKIDVGKTGRITLRPAAGDAGVAEYAYGFQQDKTTMRVKAGPDGTAVIPVTVWPGTGGVPTKRLYVRAVDAAGNISPAGPAYGLSANEPTEPKPVPHVRGDVNGDGRADVSLVLDHGFGRTSVWNVDAKEDGFETGFVGWDTGNNGGFPLFRSRAAQGDFDGDGRTDAALFREEAGRRNSLYLLKSDGNRYDSAAAPVWSSGMSSWALSTARVLAGDVDGDKKSDIVVQRNLGAGRWETLVFRGGDLGNPVSWLDTPGEWAGSAPVLADIDGDGKADLVDQRNLGGCHTVTSWFRSTGTAFAATPAELADNTSYCWERSRPEVADVDGDGKDDLVALYDYGSKDTGLWVFKNTGTALSAALWWRKAGTFDPADTALATGDYDLDGKDDVALVASSGTRGTGRQVWSLASTGTTYSAPVLGWDEAAVGAATNPGFDIENRTYEIVARHSGKCLELPAANVDDRALHQQWDCQNTLHQRFRLNRVAGTDRFEVRPAHAPSKCLGVAAASTADRAQVMQWSCVGAANQQLTLDYVEGSSYDTVVQLRFGHSSKCAEVIGASQANGARLEQLPCSAAASQQWIIRAALNTPQLDGQYKIRSEVNVGRVIDIENCNTADGANVRIWDYSAALPCQKWQFESLGDDAYRILDSNSGKPLNAAACGSTLGTVVDIATANDQACQTWRVEPSANGTYSIISTVSGLAVDIPQSNPNRGAEVHLWQYLGTSNQHWYLDRL
ncbi:RICIN domain-containing protein [Kribbella yunnanensis]|uniref:RICIN domain-containing protein n=1 Tax=Kribbella yunnanensis TaxID=190194 RepID=UPI0031E03F15